MATEDKNKPQGQQETAPARKMLHRVRNHAEHNFEMGKSTPVIGDDGKVISHAAMPWIIIPRAGIRSVVEMKDGRKETVRKMTPGECELDDEQLAAIKASPVGSSWLKPDGKGLPQLILVDSYPADSKKAAA